jgi:hypothetical protein
VVIELILPVGNKKYKCMKVERKRKEKKMYKLP